MKRFYSIFFASLLLATQAWASSLPLENRHQASGLNTQFGGDQKGFADYVTQSRAMISKTRASTNAADRDKIIEGNAPFELKPAASCPAGNGKPYRRGVLLTHGLTDSPYFMRHLATFFQENCFRVMAILLPGHGTQPGDLLDVSWMEWVKAEAYGTDKLAAEVDEVYLAGFSTGGALSIYQSQTDKRVRGLFLFSPAIKVTALAALANLHKIYSWASPSAMWLDVMPDKDYFKYESFPKNAAAQIYYLTQQVNSRMLEQDLNIPVFTAASQDDTTVNTPATVDFMAKSKNPASRLVLYSTDTKKSPAGFPADKIELVNSVVPEQKILSSAHTAIVLPSEDTHYGMAGAYSNCNHYYADEKAKFDACTSSPKEDLQGELTKENLSKGTMRRLMYNPNLPALKTSMKKFIDNLK